VAARTSVEQAPDLDPAPAAILVIMWLNTQSLPRRVVIDTVLAGAGLAGVAGMFLAVTVVAIASVAFRHCLE
jgi:predicted PurR-regulated permease PerM